MTLDAAANPPAASLRLSVPAAGLSMPPGKRKGVKRLRREVGPQITGYLVDLADKDPEMAKAYVEAMKLYWQYRLTTKPEAENGTVIPVNEDDASKPQENGTKAQ